MLILKGREMTEAVTTLIFYNQREGEALYPLSLPFGTKTIVRRLNQARTNMTGNSCTPKGFDTRLHAVYLPDGRAWDVINGFRKYGDPDYYKRVYVLLQQSHLQESYDNLGEE